MQAGVIAGRPAREVRVKRLILPTEHGSWGFLLEPLVAGTAVAFSAASPWIAVMVVGAFFARQPLKFALMGLAGSGFREQTLAAIKYTMIFGMVFLIGMGGVVATAPQWAWFPFVVVAPLAAYQIFCDATRKSRNLVPELTGAVAISATAPALALAGGLSWPFAMGLWGIFIARLIPSILYVRNRLRLEKGKESSWLEPVAAHMVALGAVGLLAFSGHASYLTAAMFAFLAVRSAVGLSPYRRRIKAMRIGVYEVIYGTLTVAAIVAGHYLGF